MADGATFRVGADVSDYVKGMTRAEASTKKVAKSAASIGDQVTGSIVKVELLKRALDAAGRAISGVLDKATAASKSAGDRAINVATSLSSLGVKDINAVSARLASGGGGATADQAAAFAKSLAGVNKQRRTPLSGDQNEALLNAYKNGGDLIYGEGGEDLTEGASKGLSAAAITERSRKKRSAVFGALSDPTAPLNVGLRARDAEENARSNEESAFLSSGAYERVNAAAARNTAAENPGGAVSIVGSVLGDTAATVTNRAMGWTPAIQAQAAQATITQADLFRKLLTQPNLSTDTK